jgi:hypothetical protein
LSRFPLSTSIPLPTSIPSGPPFRQPASLGPKSWGSFAEIGMAIDRNRSVSWFAQFHWAHPASRDVPHQLARRDTSADIPRTRQSGPGNTRQNKRRSLVPPTSNHNRTLRSLRAVSAGISRRVGNLLLSRETQ